jgi:hypothetical protein
MSPKLAGLLIATSIAAVTTAFVWIPPKPTVLVVRVGMPYDEVLKRSSYPARAHGMEPSGETGFGTIDVTKPAVIVNYDDPQYGFKLPPTKFAAITFGHSVVESITTSPMLEALPFSEAVEVLYRIQEQFRSTGWSPWKSNQSVWFDFSPQGREALHAELLRFSDSEQWLRHPQRHLRMIFRIKCMDDCDDYDDARYLIDVSFGKSTGND